MVKFKGYENESTNKFPTDKIPSEVSNNIEEFGYSIIVFHPQDLVQSAKNGTILNSGGLNSTEIDDLSQLIDTLFSMKMNYRYFLKYWVLNLELIDIFKR
jgi:hypothetical protein